MTCRASFLALPVAAAIPVAPVLAGSFVCNDAMPDGADVLTRRGRTRFLLARLQDR